MLLLLTALNGGNDLTLFNIIQSNLSKYRQSITSSDFSFQNGIIRLALNGRRTNIKTQMIIGFYSGMVWVYAGYILTISGTKLYHIGDSDQIQEMNDVQPDILLIPVSGTYVMTWEEAVKATLDIKPRVAIPIHWGSIAGNIEDAKKFKDNASCEVIIPEKE